MPGKIFGNRRPAMRFKIAACRHDPVFEGAELAAHQPRVPDIACPDDGVEPFFDDVDQSIGKIQVEIDVRIGIHERRYCRHQQHARQRKADAQLPAWNGLRSR